MIFSTTAGFVKICNIEFDDPDRISSTIRVERVYARPMDVVIEMVINPETTTNITVNVNQRNREILFESDLVLILFHNQRYVDIKYSLLCT